MKRYRSIAAAVMAVSASLISSGSAKEQHPATQPATAPWTRAAIDTYFQKEQVESDKQLEDMDKQSAQLLKQMEEQSAQDEKVLQEIQARLQELRRTTTPSEQYLIETVPLSQSGDWRHGLIPREFNGIQYYILPIAPKTATQTPQERENRSRP